MAVFHYFAIINLQANLKGKLPFFCSKRSFTLIMQTLFDFDVFNYKQRHKSSTKQNKKETR